MADRAKRQTVERFLDNLCFGKYIPYENDCDVMATKARNAIKQAKPTWETGICIMYGFHISLVFVGHGILVINCQEGDLYYDCTTQSGKDSSRFRQIGWLNTWMHYLMIGFFIFWSYTEWGDYVPSARFKRRKRLHPRWIYGRFFDKLARLPAGFNPYSGGAA